jgi:hypothetical protein
MARHPLLPKSELEIAGIVWNLNEAAARQGLESLLTDRKLGLWTVHASL